MKAIGRHWEKVVLVGTCVGWLIAGGCAPMTARGPGLRDRFGPGPGLRGSQEGLVAGVGHAPASQTDAADQADRMARQELSSLASSYADQAIVALLKSDPGYPAPESPAGAHFRSSLAASVSADLLRQPMEHETWEEGDGRLYAVYAVPTERIDAAIIDKARLYLALQNPFDRDAETLTQEFTALLENRARELKLDAARSRAPSSDIPADEALPPWLAKGEDDRYPKEDFLTAIGVTRQARGAAEDARIQLAARLSKDLEDMLGRLRETDVDDALARNVRALPDLTVRFGLDDVVATRVAERWRDPSTGDEYALAVLARKTASLILEREVARALKTCESLSASATNHDKAENYADSLGDYLDALVSAQQAVALQLRALAVAPEDTQQHVRALLPDPVAEQLRASLQSLMAQLEIEKVGGDQQWLVPDAPPRRPFSAALTGGDPGQPLEGVPVRLCLGGISGRPVASAHTDAQGVVIWRVAEPLPCEGASGLLVAVVDAAEMAPGVSTAGLDVPTATFCYVFRTRDRASFVVAVEGGEAAVTIADAVTRAMVSQGFQPVEKSELLKHVKPRAPGTEPSDARALETFADLRRSLGPDAFLLIVAGAVGTESIETHKTAEGQLYIASFPFDVRVLDPDLAGDDKVVAAATGTGQQACLDDEAEARRRARADAAGSVADHITQALSAKFGPPARAERAGR